MRILVLAPHPFHVERGTPIDVDLLLRALSARGDEVDVVVYPDGEDRTYPGVTLHRVRVPGWARNVRPGFSLKKVFTDGVMLFRAWRLARRHRYDVVHAGEESVFMAMLFRWLHGTPYVYDLDSSIAQQIVEQMGFLRPFAPIFNWMERKALQKCIAAAPVCNALADLAREAGAAHVVTLHDISQLSEGDLKDTGELRERLGLSGRIMVYVGNLEPYQGVDLLLESHKVALERGANVDLVVAGGTPEHVRAYQAMAERLGVAARTRFIGPWPASRLGELLAQADILVAPRIKGINTPMKVFPYLHSGKPVLVTDLPTHTQVLDDSVAYLAPAEPQGFGEAIVRLAEDEALCRRLGEAGRQFVERNHTYPWHQERVNALYTEVERRSRLPRRAPETNP